MAETEPGQPEAASAAPGSAPAAAQRRVPDGELTESAAARDVRPVEAGSASLAWADHPRLPGALLEREVREELPRQQVGEREVPAREAAAEEAAVGPRQQRAGAPAPAAEPRPERGRAPLPRLLQQVRRSADRVARIPGHCGPAGEPARRVRRGRHRRPDRRTVQSVRRPPIVRGSSSRHRHRESSNAFSFRRHRVRVAGQ